MQKTAIIMPGSFRNQNCVDVCIPAIASCVGSCDAELVFIDNGLSEDTTLADRWSSLIRDWGVTYHRWEAPFSLNKIWNWGRDITESEHIAYTNADVLFYPNWLKNMYSCWEEAPDYDVVQPFTYSKDADHFSMTKPEFRGTTVPDFRIVPGALGWFYLMRRSLPHRWDDQFTDWKSDMDFNNTAREKKWKMGICWASRVNHFVGKLRPHTGVVDPEHEYYHQDTKKMIAKWNTEAY